MTLTFPTGPSLNDETTTGGRTYKWNGQAWELVGSGIAGPTGPTGVGDTNQQTTPTALSSTGYVDPYTLGDGDIFRLSAATGVSIWSLAATGGEKLLINVGATGSITLQHATGANSNAQFNVSYQSGYLLYPNGGSALIVYDDTDNVWRVV